MINGLQATKLIAKLLTQNENLKKLVGKKIHPLVVDPSKTNLPYICFSRTNLDPEYTKDGGLYDEVGIEVAVFSSKYEESIDIASEVRKTLELVRYKDKDLAIGGCKLVSVRESFGENAFLQLLTFQLVIY